MLWSHLVDFVGSALFVCAQWFGGSFGAAILVGSTLVRVALLPVTARAARRRVERERKLAALAPQLERIKKRHADRPERMLAETQRLYAANELSMLDNHSLVASLVQFPPAALLYSAIRNSSVKGGSFLWVADLAKPDRLLAGLASLIAATLAWVSAGSQSGKPGAQVTSVIITGVVTLLILSQLSAGLALYSIANSTIGGIERLLALRRTPRDK